MRHVEQIQSVWQLKAGLFSSGMVDWGTAPPTVRELANEGGPPFEHNLTRTSLMRDEGIPVHMEEFGNLPSVGHIFFYPKARAPPNPSLESLRKFQHDNPDLPVVEDNKGRECEVPHIVLAKFLEVGHGNIDAGEADIAVDRKGRPIVVLFTIATSSDSIAFHPKSHVKGSTGEQYQGVNILDWRRVNFDDEFGPTTTAAYGKIVKYLAEMELGVDLE